MPASSAAPSLVRRKGIRSKHRNGFMTKYLYLCGESRELVLIVFTLIFAMTILLIGMRLGSHHAPPALAAPELARNTFAKLDSNQRQVPNLRANTNSSIAAPRERLVEQKIKQPEPNIREKEEAGEKKDEEDQEDYDDDNNKSKEIIPTPHKDSITVKKPQAHEAYVQKFAQHKHDSNKNIDVEEEVQTKEILKAHEESMRQFAKHIHLDEQGHFGDLDESIGIELSSKTRANLPNLMSNLFRFEGGTAIPFIFGAWVQIDPPEESETGSKRILSVGPDLKDCDTDGQIKGEVQTGNSGMIRFYTNHDQTADEVLILDWSPGGGRGCYSIASSGYQVSLRKWTHVAFSIDPIEWVARLYINGELVAEEVNEEPAQLYAEVFPSSPDKKLVSDTSDTDSVMFLGRGMEQADDHGELTLTLDGRIALVSVWSHNETLNLVKNSPVGEAGLLSQVHEAGYDATAVQFLESLKPLQPDYLYALNEWSNIEQNIRSGHDVNAVLTESVYSRHGSLRMDADRVESLANTRKTGDEPTNLFRNGLLADAKRMIGLTAQHLLHPYGQAVDEKKNHPNLRAGFRKETHPGNPFRFFVPKGGRRYKEYINGTTPAKITPQMIEESDKLARERRVYVKDAMIHAWSGYKKYAFGADELLPLSKKPSENWGGVGATLIDALDTLWLMGLHDEFWEARDWVRDNLSYSNVGAVSVFETTIRSLGGLLSAYDLSGDPVFLEKADDLGSRLLHSFESPNGIPYGQTELNAHKSYNAQWQKNRAIIAEAGTLQVEFRFLAHATKKPIYAEKANKVFDYFVTNQPSSGLYPLYVRNDIPGVSFSFGKVTLGAMGDSLYEYMLKTWLQSGEIEDKYRTMFDRAMDGVHNQLVHKSIPDGLTYVADLQGNRLDHKMDHLACFMGGLWALGAYTNPDGLESFRAQRDLAHGKALTYTCYQMYARFPTGLSPEFVRFDRNPKDVDFSIGQAPSYLLRPEVVESLFILNYLTRDPVYREWGWEIFQAIERFCRTEDAFGQFKDVRKLNEPPLDKMESFFLAETLKYLYLLFDPDTPIDILNTHVFNTEAHPLSRFDRVEDTKTALKKAIL